jgi:hypothetical protein
MKRALLWTIPLASLACFHVFDACRCAFEPEPQSALTPQANTTAAPVTMRAPFPGETIKVVPLAEAFAQIEVGMNSDEACAIVGRWHDSAMRLLDFDPKTGASSSHGPNSGWSLRWVSKDYEGTINTRHGKVESKRLHRKDEEMVPIPANVTYEVPQELFTGELKHPVYESQP